jgi:proline iminopeptidase
MYPLAGPYHCGHLRRPLQHRLYYEEHGNPGGMPAVVLHGGPGSGCRPALAGFFDPQRYRVVLPDQRGAGRSWPQGRLQGNDTAALVEDLEVLRRVLGIERWLVFGGSWGATLGLCYARAHPERVTGLVLRGTLAGRRRDRDWVFGADGAARLFPAAYAGFRSLLPDAAADPVGGYWRLLHDPREQIRLAAARAWLAWEDHVALQQPPPANSVPNLHRALIACHYAHRDFFLDPVSGALPDSGELDAIPGVIIHGERDLVCPVDQALELHRRWPTATLEVIAGAGHLSDDAAIQTALVRATDALTRP